MKTKIDIKKNVKPMKGYIQNQTINIDQIEELIKNYREVRMTYGETIEGIKKVMYPAFV